MRLRLQFDRVLRVFEMQRDEVLTEAAKIELTLEMLIKNWRSLRRVDIVEKANICKALFEGVIFEGAQKKKDDDGSPPVVSFTQDAPFIYAGFMMDYGIDLYKQVGRRGAMDWRLFLALFRGLSEKTKMREIMGIRARPLPKATKYNQEEIHALREAKAFYRVRLTEEEAHRNLQKGIAGLAQMLTQGR